MDKKTIFITGTKRELSLGTALVKKYLAEDYHVFASARGIENVVHMVSLRDNGAALTLIDMDLTKVEEVKNAAATVKELAGRLDILIASATSTYHEGNLPVDDGLDIENAPYTHNVNAGGFIRLTQQFLPIFSENAKIVAISSEQGSMGDCWRDAGLDYGMAKAALNYAAVVLQRRLGKRGLRVLSIHPGWVQTHPAPPKADLTPDESAAAIFATINNPPPYVEKGNLGVFINWDGTHKNF